MSCKKFVENISAYFDEELDEKTQQKTFAHVEQCESCMSYYRQFKMLQNKIKLQLVHHQAPAFISHRLMSRIAEDKRKQPSPRFVEKAGKWLEELLWIGRPVVRFAKVAAVFLVAVFAGIQIYHVLSPEHSGDNSMMADIQPIKSEDFFQTDLADYFAKSKRVLKTIQQAPPSGNNPLTVERELATELLLKSQLISYKLNRQKDSLAGELLKDLEPLLIDVANYDQQQDRRSVELWKRTIDNNNYLSRITMTQANFNY